MPAYMSDTMMHATLNALEKTTKRCVVLKITNDMIHPELRSTGRFIRAVLPFFKVSSFDSIGKLMSFAFKGRTCKKSAASRYTFRGKMPTKALCAYAYTARWSKTNRPQGYYGFMGADTVWGSPSKTVRLSRVLFRGLAASSSLPTISFPPKRHTLQL